MIVLHQLYCSFQRPEPYKTRDMFVVALHINQIEQIARTSYAAMLSQIACCHHQLLLDILSLVTTLWRMSGFREGNNMPEWTS